MFRNLIDCGNICREGTNKDIQARVMTWQPQCLSDALPPPQKGRDESEHTQVELV
jgi:hypothetical protein